MTDAEYERRRARRWARRRAMALAAAEQSAAFRAFLMDPANAGWIDPDVLAEVRRMDRLKRRRKKGVTS